jgi:hypothetical protein
MKELGLQLRHCHYEKLNYWWRLQQQKKQTKNLTLVKALLSSGVAMHMFMLYTKLVFL